MSREKRRTMWKGMTGLGLVAAAAVILALCAGVASAKKGGGGKPPREEPQDPSPDAGIIYFNFSSTICSMAWDGSDKQSLGLIAAYHVDPSELTHGGERWFLTVDSVDGTYPNGYPRWEIFAVSESGTRVQLTDAPDVETLGAWPENSSGDWRAWYVQWGARPGWFCDDTKVSYWARRWQDGTVVEGSDGLYEVDVDLSTTIPDTTPTKLELNLGPLWELGGPPYDWSPDGTQIVYEHDSMSYEDAGAIFVLDVDPYAEPLRIGSGSGAEWSPLRADGTSRILFLQRGDSHRNANYVYSVNADGSEATLMLDYSGKRKESVYCATWSPNATHLAYSVTKEIRKQRLQRSVHRANAQGEYETDLTTIGLVFAWRAE